MSRGTSNTAIRGSAADRRRRKQALLNRDGDGVKAPCWECGAKVDFHTMVCDKIKAGRDGGRYVLANLRVHCHPCSMLQGHRMGLETRRWRAWEKRGLRTSRTSPAGVRNPLAGHWYVYLDGTSVGWLERAGCSGQFWKAYQYSMTEAQGAVQEDWDGQPLKDVGDRHGWRVGAYHRTKRAALYALLVECTTTQKRKAA